LNSFNQLIDFKSISPFKIKTKLIFHFKSQVVKQMSVKKVSEIDMIAFGISSADEIRNNAVCCLTSTKTSVMPGTVYDPKMGAAMDSREPCVTCGLKIDTCPGHFGYIELNHYVINPLFYKQVYQHLKCICMNPECNRLLINEEQLKLYGLHIFKGEARFSRILEKLEKVDLCCHCNHSQPKLSYSTTENIISMSYKKQKNEDGTKSTITVSLDEDEIQKIFDNVTDDDVRILGFDSTYVHPKNFVMSVFPVAPPSIRPFVYTDGQICDDDLTIQYVEIIKYNNHLGSENLDEKCKPEYLKKLKFYISTLFNNSKKKAKHPQSSRALKGFAERLKGKEGLIRGHLMGKRVDFSARTPIGADPTLRLEQLAIPPEVASILTIPERVTAFNIEKMTEIVNNCGANSVVNGKGAIINLKFALNKKGTKLFYKDIIIRDEKEIKISDVDFELKKGDKIKRNGKILEEVVYPEKKKYRLSIGDIVNRKLRDGDYVLLNRQPTLHAGSMMAMKILVVPGKSFRMNLSITKSFNADFDGDEMNIHVPQSLEAQAELEELSSVKHKIISTQTSTANIVIVQDSLLGAFKMTKGFRIISKDSYNDIVMKLDLPTSGGTADFLFEKHKMFVKVLLKKKGFSRERAIECIHSGKGLFSLLFPDDFCYENTNKSDTDEPTVKIYRGILYEGVVSKTNLSGGNSSLILLLHKEYGKDTVANFIDNVQFLTNNWLMNDGFTIGIGDCMATKQGDISEAVKDCFAKAEEISKITHHPGIREMRVSAALNEAKDLGLRIAKDGLGKDNGFVSTVTAGSKGDYFNIGQITGLLGQQNLEGKRIPLMLNQGRRSLPHYELGKTLSTEEEFESKGFIKSSFIGGLNPKEFYFHMMTGREGVMDTAMKTSKSGYIQRKLVKCGEDIIVGQDGRTTDTTGNTYQIVYGSDSLDPARAININGESQCCDVSRIVNRINLKREEFSD
jgi:DNA-directed RNA polymerase beta' subunit